MKHSELIENITKSTGKTPKQKELANILNKPVGTINSRASRDLHYTYEELNKIEEYYRIGITNKPFIDDMNDKSGEHPADYYPETLGSCGNGTFSYSDIKYKIKIPKRCIGDYYPFADYSVINAYGDSMIPTIQSKDLLIIKHWDKSGIDDNEVYVFCYDDQIYVKRLIKNIDELIIKSDNPDPIYKTKTIAKEDMNNVHIIGKVVGLMRAM